MKGRLLAIGDIHGCIDALASLWAMIQPQSQDTVVLIGDYVDRGHDSRGVIEFLLQHARDCRLVPLLGNHDAMFMAALRSRAAWRRWMEWGGQATLDSYSESGSISDVPSAHRSWLNSCTLFFETADHFFVHANYDPALSFTDQARNTLLSESLDERVPGPHTSGKRAVVGHTVQTSGQILNLGHLVCIDTGCGIGGWLTALDVDSLRVWQVTETGTVRANQQPTT